MSLLELLLASGLFLGSTGASLAVWGRASVVLAEDRDRLVSLDALEAEMQAEEARLRDPALSLAGATTSCPEQLRRLAGALEAQPAQAGVVREVLVPVGQGVLELRLRAGAQERVRSYNPGAFGGCGSAAPAAAVAAEGVGTNNGGSDAGEAALHGSL